MTPGCKQQKKNRRPKKWKHEEETEKENTITTKSRTKTDEMCLSYLDWIYPLLRITYITFVDVYHFKFTNSNDFPYEIEWKIHEKPFLRHHHPMQVIVIVINVHISSDALVSLLFFTLSFLCFLVAFRLRFKKNECRKHCKKKTKKKHLLRN